MSKSNSSSTTSVNSSTFSLSDRRFYIFEFRKGPYPSRVRIALDEKALLDQVTFEEINLMKGEHKTAEFLEKTNYSGTVPVLRLEDGTLIAECTAITVYLDSLDDNPTLTGTTPLEKGLIHMMSKRAEMEVLDAISVYYHHATPGLGPLVDVPERQNREWGLRMKDKAERGMRYFNGLLSQQSFLVADRFTMADITLCGALIFSEMKLPIPEDCQALKEWWARMKQRPSLLKLPVFMG